MDKADVETERIASKETADVSTGQPFDVQMNVWMGRIASTVKVGVWMECAARRSPATLRFRFTGDAGFGTMVPENCKNTVFL